DRGVLDDTLVLYLLGDNGASGEGGVEGTIREHLVGHGFADDVAAMDAARDQIGDPTTYPIYPVGWAIAMNTPYQWTKQVASHFGGTRDGCIVHWPSGIEARGEIRHQFHHLIDVLPTLLDATELPAPETVEGMRQQPIEGVSMRYSFDDADAPDRRRTQYFEMVGNRGIYHDGWTAVTRHGVPWLMTEEPQPFEGDVWELYDTYRDWAQANDLAHRMPERLRELQALFHSEGERYRVFPLDDRVTERENPDLAGRVDPMRGRQTVTFGPRTGRLTEEIAPNVKNRSHTITVDVEVSDEPAEGVLVAQGGRFGGWSLYCHEGKLSYAYNWLGWQLTTIRADPPLEPGKHEVVMDFAYAGGPPGDAAAVALAVDEQWVGAGRIVSTTAYYFSFDETFNVGRDPGTPVTDDYPPVRNAFSGTIDRVRIDLGPAIRLDPPDETRISIARND
ncbi:MAG TPA: sulfatase-like hydrolase/transferase, partial [Nocardioidaceae bacterium]|nr:sulfatase-like hydrolase/transferase [Nocardioidaceae bacterium]